MVSKVRKKRLDLLLVERNLVESREKAKLEIMMGHVKVKGETVRKPSRMFDEDVEISIIEPMKYVSRGALKLKGALKDFGISRKELEGKTACDMGSSTGGFTQVLLEYGVKKVYAVDVGYGVLHWKLRKDPRVIVMERTNARYLNDEMLGEKVDLVTCDLSFISVRKVLDAILSILKDEGKVFMLIKPQFEAERYRIKRGVVRDRETHVEVLKNILGYIKEHNLNVVDLTFSKLRGPKGNIEFFAYLMKSGENIPEFRILEIVDEAHSFFERKGEDEES